MFQGLFTQEARLSLDIERDTFLEPGNTLMKMQITNELGVYWNISRECACASVIGVHVRLMHTICHVLSALTKTHVEI